MRTTKDKTRVVEIRAKHVLNRAPPGMGFRWSLNPYRGCQHGCVYCYARYTHTFFDLDPTRDFSRVVFVKTNVVEVLRRELRRPSWRRERVSVGTATDPYQPLEGRYRLMPGIIRALAEFYTPFTIVTKNTFVLADADLLAEAARRTGVAVIFSITTVDPEVAHRLEPDTPGPHQRLRVAHRLRERGIPTAIALAPILPGITDGEEALRTYFRALKAWDLPLAFFQPLRLYEDTREAWFAFLRTHYPRLVPAYRRGYTRRDPPREYTRRVSERVESLRQAFRVPLFEFPHPPDIQGVLLEDSPPAGRAS